MSMKWVSQFYGGGAGGGGLLCYLGTIELILMLKNPLMLLGTVDQTVIFTSVSINNVSPFVLSRITIFTYALWSHLSEEGQNLRL